MSNITKVFRLDNDGDVLLNTKVEPHSVMTINMLSFGEEMVAIKQSQCLVTGLQYFYLIHRKLSENVSTMVKISKSTFANINKEIKRAPLVILIRKVSCSRLEKVDECYLYTILNGADCISLLELEFYNEKNATEYIRPDWIQGTEIETMDQAFGEYWKQIN